MRVFLTTIYVVCLLWPAGSASASDVVRDKKGNDFPCTVKAFTKQAFLVDMGSRDQEEIRKAKLANVDRVLFDPNPIHQLDMVRLKSGHQISLKVLGYDHRRFVVETDHGKRKKVPVESIDRILFNTTYERPFMHRSFADTKTPTSFKIAYWNMEWFPGGMENATRDSIYTQTEEVAKILNRQRPTILFASEVRNLKAAVRLNHQLDKPYAHIAVTDYWAENTDDYGSPRCKQEAAVLSDIPLTSVREIDLGRDDMVKPRITKGLLRVSFKAHGKRVVAYVCHFKSNFIRKEDRNPEETHLKNVEKREELARQIVLDIKRTGLNPMKDRVIICGDFNTDAYVEKFKGEKTLPILIRAGFHNNMDAIPPRSRITIPRKEGEPYPDGTFDYFLTSRGLGPVDVSVLQEGAGKHIDILPGMKGHASDHYMISFSLPR